VGGAGSDLGLVGQRAPLGALAEDSVRTGEPRRASLPSNAGAELVAPLMYRGHAIGVLTVRSTVPFGDADGHLLALLAAVTGNAVGTAQEYDLRDRMASLGRLAAGMAHEINNPLAYVAANVSHVLEVLAESTDGRVDVDELREALEDAQRGAHRITAIVSQLRVFSRSPVDAQHRVDVAEVLRQTVRMAAHEVRPRARLIDAYAPSPAVLGNEVQLGQVFLNLLINAAQAIPQGQEGARVEARLLGVVGREVVVEISDTGVGIPAEDLPRIFDPFFTTKPIGTGTGLGLSISYGIVRAHGGQITVKSERGRGSTFRVTLPVAPDAATEPVRRSESGHYPAVRRRMLVVDDEPTLCASLARLFGRAYDVETATGARLALRELLSGPAYDVVVCSMSLRDLSGTDLHRSVVAARPDLASRFVFLAGDGMSDDDSTYLARARCRHVERTSDPAMMRDAVAAVLDGEE
jgi:signal transduction histidine kinase